MVMAISAFVLQGALISISQALAAVEIMPQPSVTLNGSAHFHDQLTGHVHDHGSNAEGHIHNGPDADKDGGLNLCWSIFAPFMIVPAPLALARSFDLLGPVELPILQNLQALEQRRDGSFIIQRGGMIVKIIAIFNDFLLFPAPEHWENNGEIHASLLLIRSFAHHIGERTE